MRLFVGIPVQAGDALAGAVRELRKMEPSAKVVAPGKLHVTLRFLGEVPDAGPVEVALLEALHDAAPLRGALVGVGGFPDARRARVAWAGVEAPGLAEVAQRVRSATEGLGLPESHPFVAHLTLARLPHPQDLGAWCARHATQRWGDFAAGTVVLYRSRTGGPGSAAYEALATVALGPQA